MLIAIAILHVIATIALILIVLLQTGRGSEIGAAFGSGSSQTLFGSSGSSGFMTKLTTATVVIFMVTSLLLAYFYSHREYVIKGAPAPVSVPAPASAPANVPAPAGAPVAPEKAPTK
jgi:preprotein translocase subunit SecG